MTFKSNDLDEYPGSRVPALKVDFEQLIWAAQKIGVTVTHESGGSHYSPARRVINIDTKTPNQRGFVSIGQLTDEYLHAWNQYWRRGTFLDAVAAKEHVRLGKIAESVGTANLGTSSNAAFHKLEALNFFMSGKPIPSFIWRAPKEDVQRFGWSWEQHF